LRFSKEVEAKFQTEVVITGWVERIFDLPSVSSFAVASYWSVVTVEQLVSAVALKSHTIENTSNACKLDYSGLKFRVHANQGS